MKNGAQKKHLELSPARRAEVTKEFDREFVADTFRPMNSENSERWERAKRKSKGGIGTSGAMTISIRVEKTLLKRSDILAKKNGLTRDALIDRALKSVLAANGQEA